MRHRGGGALLVVLLLAATPTADAQTRPADQRAGVRAGADLRAERAELLARVAELTDDVEAAAGR
ncbi:MAG: hypothetical protein H0U89_10450, partial [Acidimicrobiia bacterium]|nr:hypothetical protein [Acidimicrobiia bacterium]